MSLRLRLTLLYATLMGAILLVIGAAVVMIVRILLLNGIDANLDSLQKAVIENSTVSPIGKVEIDYAAAELTSDVHVQVWGIDTELQTSFGQFKNFESTPLDPASLRNVQPLYRDLRGEDWHIRVLTVPLEQKDQIIAVLQIASRLNVV